MMIDGVEIKFCVEDTIDKCYRDFTASLLSRGWKKNPYRKRTKLEKKRLPIKDVSLVVCTLNEKDLDFSELTTQQICNHFDGIDCLTTKRGYCELLKDLTWVCEDELDISPRSYNLGDPIHRQEFIDEFKIVAASNILKWSIIIDSIGSQDNRKFSKLKIKRNVFRNCLAACAWYLRVKMQGEWPGVDISSVFKDQEVCLDEQKWNDILQLSYELSDCDVTWPTQILRNILEWKSCSDIYVLEPVNIRARLILRGFAAYCRQFYMDGLKNIWVVKAPESSCGRGIKLFYKLEDILDWDRGVGGRTVQKYIETPLLASHSSTASSSPRPEVEGQLPMEEVRLGLEPLIKFDLRVWVLITSIQPLVVYIYSNVYGRSCSSSYSNSVKTLSNNFAHLTNYSVQKKRTKIETDTAYHSASDSTGNVIFGESESETVSKFAKNSASSTNKLRAVCNSFRSRDSGGGGVNVGGGGSLPYADITKTDRFEVTEEELLLSHVQVVEILNAHTKRRSSTRVSSKSREPSSNECVWNDKIWPEVKRKILVTIEATKDKIVHRNRSFEFLGYDILLDEQLNPWILEANMSPAMAHRSEEQSKLIACMCEGIVNLAVMPWVRDGQCIHSRPNIVVEDDSNKYGAWEILHDDNLMQQQMKQEIQQQQPKNDLSNLSNNDKYAVEECDWIEIKPPKSHSGRPSLVSSLRKQALSKSRPLSSSSSSSRREKKGVSMGPSWCSPNIDLTNTQAADNGGVGEITGKESSSVTTVAPYVCPSSVLQSLEITGKTVSDATIFTVDILCDKFMRVLLLQRWVRRYIIRTRLYHSRRKSCSIVIQCAVRQHLSRCQLSHLRYQRTQLLRRIACIKIQSQLRRLFAEKLLKCLRKEFAAKKIQCQFRIRIARQIAMMKLKERNALRIFRWYRGRCTHRRRRAANRIVKAARRWCKWRKRCAKIVFHCIALFYRKKKRKIKSIQRAMRQKLCRIKLAHAYRLVKLRHVAKDAVLRWREVRHRMLVKNERFSASVETTAMGKEEEIASNIRTASTIFDMVYKDLLPIIISNAESEFKSFASLEETRMETVLERFDSSPVKPSDLPSESTVSLSADKSQSSAKKAGRKVLPSTAFGFSIHDFILSHDIEQQVHRENADYKKDRTSSHGAERERPQQRSQSDYERQLETLTQNPANDELLRSPMRKSFTAVSTTSSVSRLGRDVSSLLAVNRPKSASKSKGRSVSFNLDDPTKRDDKFDKLQKGKPSGASTSARGAAETKSGDSSGGLLSSKTKKQLEKLGTSEMDLAPQPPFLSLSSNSKEVEALLQARRNEMLFRECPIPPSPWRPTAAAAAAAVTSEALPPPHDPVDHPKRSTSNLPLSDNVAANQHNEYMESKDATEDAIFAVSVQQANTILTRFSNRRSNVTCAAEEPLDCSPPPSKLWKGWDEWATEDVPLAKVTPTREGRLPSNDHIDICDTRSEKSGLRHSKVSSSRAQGIRSANSELLPYTAIVSNTLSERGGLKQYDRKARSKQNQQISKAGSMQSLNIADTNIMAKSNSISNSNALAAASPMGFDRFFDKLLVKESRVDLLASPPPMHRQKKRAKSAGRAMMR